MSKLSDRVRPDVEAAAWVIAEIKTLEAGAASRDAEVAELEKANGDCVHNAKNALDSMQQQNDQLREQVMVLRETLDGIRIANWREWDDCVRSADHFVDWSKSRAEYTLAATEPRSTK